MVEVPFFRAIVVRKAKDGEIVFHKYNTVKKGGLFINRFEQNMVKKNESAGPVIHINYYSKQTGRFSYQTKFK